MQDLTATREAGFAKIWARDSEVAMTERAEMRDQDHPPAAPFKPASSEQALVKLR